MPVSFVPGEPNQSTQAVAHAQWRGHSVMAYCSGNNLIVLADDMAHLQTVYLDADALVVDINPHNGNIAVAIGSHVHVYEPLNEFMKVPRWRFLTKLSDEDDHSRVNSISWGVKDELVVGSDSLTLWNVKKDYGIVKTFKLWSLKQANPVYLVKISQDSTLIASVSKYDKLLKVWNRVAFSESSNFDLTYLLHSSSITNIRWKRHDPNNPPTTDALTHTLYTLSRDSVLRVWSSYVHDNHHIVQHWGSLELNDHECEPNGKSFVNIVDDYLITNALRAAIERLYKDEPIDIQKKQPDVALVSNKHGELSVYALENLSQNPPKMINITKLKTVKYKRNTFVSQPEFLNFAESLNDTNGDLSIIIHDLNGVIRNVKVDLTFLLDADSSDTTGYLAHKLTGHNKSIQHIYRTSDGKAMLTSTRFDESAVWIPQNIQTGVTLTKKSILKTPNPITKAVVFEKGNMVLTYCSQFLILWNTTEKIAKEAFRLPITSDEDPILFASIPLPKHNEHRHYVVAIFKHSTKGWAIHDIDKIQEIDVDDLPIDYNETDLIAPIDPVGAGYQSNRAVISTISSKGELNCFSSTIENDRIVWNLKFKLGSGIANPQYIRGSSISKFAIVDQSKRKLTIWDLQRGVLEYEETLDHDVKDIDWTSTANKQSILAVGFDDHSLLYTQQRYDYTNSNPPYLAIKKIDIKNYTPHVIGDSIWLDDGTLVIGAGNQMFVADKELDLVYDKFTKKSIGTRNIVSNDILNLSAVLNGLLPLYHPQFLIQALFVGRFEVVKEILLNLFLKIRELDLKGESINQLGSSLGFDVSKVFDDGYKATKSYEEPFTEFNDKVAELLKEKLMNLSLPYLTRHQQITLMSTVEAVTVIDKNVMSLDDHGLRFVLSVKLFQLHKSSQEKLAMRDITWALHSENKELLLQFVEESVDDKISWSVAKEYGLAHWVRHDDLITLFDKIAKREFTTPETRDPSNCSIFYLALKKKQILVGLWRTSFGHPEQSKMMNFLKNDFKEKRWRSAALKNAFVLLSKHRYMDAACFFLLGDSLKDCVNVLVRQVDDFDLAVAVCRVFEGDNGPVLQDILTRILLSTSLSNGDRWSTSYIFWKSRDRTRAIQALVKHPVDCATEQEKKKIQLSEKSKFFLEDDPLLVVLYQALREKNFHYFHGSLKIPPEEEFQFILRVAAIYTRMGCDYLSISLTKNWKFLKLDNLKKVDSSSNFRQSTSPSTTTNHNSMLEKYGFSPSARRRKSFISDYKQEQDNFITKHLNGDHAHSNSSSVLPNGYPSTGGISMLEKYGLAPTIKESTKDEENKKKKHYTPPPQAEFKEPDMSAFNFGF